MTCPFCHSVERLGVRLPPLKAAIFDRIKRAGDIGVTSDEIVADLYRDRSAVKPTVISRTSPRSTTYSPAAIGESDPIGGAGA